MASTATREELTALIDQAVSALRSRGRTYHSLCLERDRGYIAQGDYFGVENLLSVLREMDTLASEGGRPIVDDANDPLPQLLARIRSIASELEGQGKERWHPGAYVQAARPDSVVGPPRQGEIAPSTLIAGLAVLGLLVAVAWVGSMVVGLFAALYVAGGQGGTSRSAGAANGATSGFVALVIIYVVVFAGHLAAGKGERGIAVGILAGVGSCVLIWLIRWLS